MIEYGDDEFEFLDLKSEVKPFDTLPLHVIRCSSFNCQNLYVGLPKENLVSENGLKRFSGFKLNTLNMLPHPLG
jgi:hypothetical protein